MEKKVLDLDSRLDLYSRIEKMCEYANKLLEEKGEKRTRIEVTPGIMSYGETFPPEEIHLQISEKVKPKSPKDYEHRKVAVCFPSLEQARVILWFVIELLQVLVRHSQEKN